VFGRWGAGGGGFGGGCAQLGEQRPAAGVCRVGVTLGAVQITVPSEIGLGYRLGSALVPLSYAEQHIGEDLGSR
jgi:hypothetical protein